MIDKDGIENIKGMIEIGCMRREKSGKSRKEGNEREKRIGNNLRGMDRKSLMEIRKK